MDFDLVSFLIGGLAGILLCVFGFILFDSDWF